MQYGIEQAVGNYIKSHYRSAVEVGFGGKTVAAEIVSKAGIPVLCTDVHSYPECTCVSSVVDDCVEPKYELYEGVDVIYAVRPGIEIVPALIDLAKRVNADLIIYHLGFEIYMNGGERIESEGVQLHRYVKKQV
ncbi:MAG TPA: UPF0146 family protein [Methanocorpusculum sp.]|nr:UPF0146 family protein [Methanocorpusculum sp.]